MTNIYNKKILVNNGTLIGNWFEEEELRKITKEGRTIPGKHIKKVTIDGEKVIPKEYIGIERDVTKVRINGEDKLTNYNTTNSTYGIFERSQEKYQNTGIKERIFRDFFASHLSKEKVKELNHIEKVDNLRLNDSTKSTLHKAQIYNYESIGKRHMFNQDGAPLKEGAYDRLFMGKHDMSKLPSVINPEQAKLYVDSSIPYYKDKEITFWSMNLEKSNIYRSHTNGENPFGRSSGLTQPISQTRAVKGYYGNVTNNKQSKNVYYNELEEQFIKNYNENLKEKVYHNII